ncbi:CCDC90 family protein [Methylobacterium sp. J-026]|uniref:CCDC90 family protein n=1 Tax=Methylobacterium sp. J-026 TaxID=2836624 RepID=UPI001FBA6D3E|nr:CCDC90 family protein [Methylobacterium sp. J-026]MCJ2133710.1 CCDC90 family protein [Methylobacterium sp. J-026]
MSLAALDTLAIARTLQAAGFSDVEADAVTGALRDAREAILAGMASQADLRIAIADLQYAILKWLVVAAMGFQAMVIVGAVAALSVGPR